MRKTVPATCFICAWQALRSPRAVAALFGQSHNAVTVRAVLLRRLGVPLACVRGSSYGRRQRGVKSRRTRRLIALARMA